MKRVTSFEYAAFIERHLGHISVSGVVGAIRWVNCYTSETMAYREELNNQTVYFILNE